MKVAIVTIFDMEDDYNGDGTPYTTVYRVEFEGAAAPPIGLNMLKNDTFLLQGVVMCEQLTGGS